MITVLGSSGFIGSNLVSYLSANGMEYFAPAKDHPFKKNQHLGHVVYCIGLTADFRKRPFDTVKAHVCKLMEILENAEYDSFLYLSSTRVYNNAAEGIETADLKVNPLEFSDLYNISKLMGEAVCLSIPDKKVRIARLSNVIGNDFSSENFLFSLIKEAVDDKKIVLRLPLDQVKDYISIDDVIQLILLVSGNGAERIYNFASGIPISNREILDKIKGSTHCGIEVEQHQNSLKFPVISTRRITDEFLFEPTNVLDGIETLINNYKQLQ
jgi:nucleoside-diphosphate-sugar epimerase